MALLCTEHHGGTPPRDHFIHILPTLPTIFHASPSPSTFCALHKLRGGGAADYFYWAGLHPRIHLWPRNRADEPQGKVREQVNIQRTSGTKKICKPKDRVKSKGIGANGQDQLESTHPGASQPWIPGRKGYLQAAVYSASRTRTP